MALGVLPDQVRLLVEVDPRLGVHKLVKAIKGRTSRVLREEFPSLRSRLPTLGTNSYFVAATRGAPLAAVKTYVREAPTTRTARGVNAPQPRESPAFGRGEEVNVGGTATPVSA